VCQGAQGWVLYMVHTHEDCVLDAVVAPVRAQLELLWRRLWLICHGAQRASSRRQGFQNGHAGAVARYRRRVGNHV
jgi:hypothetical protein